MSMLGRIIKRTTANLSRTVENQALGRIVTLSSVHNLYGEGEDVGRRQTIPKLGETATSGIYKRPERISPEDLERAYRMDELVFGIINKYITVILGTGFTVRAANEKERILTEDWLRTMKINSILRDIIRDLFVFGYGFVEKIYNESGTKLVRLGSIDSKTMDFNRDPSGTIIVDNWGLPIGFEQSVWTVGGALDGYQTSQIPRESIAFFRLFTTSGALIGISPLECVYNIITWRKNVEWAMGEGAFTYAAPPIIINVGDKEMATPQDMIDSIADEITEIGGQSVFVFPWHVKVDRLEASRGMKELTDFADHFAVSICNALMIPPALMGIDVGSSRAIAELASEWERTIEGIQTMLSEQLEEQIMVEAARQLQLTEVPHIDWNSVSPAMALSRSRRRATYARAGLLFWTFEAENQIRAEENLPPLPKGFVPPEQRGLDGTVKKMIDDAISVRGDEDEDDKKRKEEEEEEDD